ncbi:MAG: NAD-dependent epimerase/dehydratase family protein [Bacteroidota bacterium]
MKIVIIGGTGHIGTYLIPRLIKDGHEVVCVSRQQSSPYNQDPAWESVNFISIDRTESERQGTFGNQIAELEGEIVIDLICFTLESAQMLAGALKDKVEQLIHCGTMWVHGYSEQVPTTENQPRKPFGDYGIKKAQIESYLLELYQQENLPVTILHPGHITGPGWLPINPEGHLDPQVFYKLAKGEPISLPNIGMETVHHVHADDVAQAFQKAIGNKRSLGESFHVVSEQALTLRGYAEALAAWFGIKPQISFLPWEEWKKGVSDKDAELTWDHIAHSPNGSIEKAKRILKYSPQYSSLEAIQESVKHYFAKEGLH